MSHNLPIYIIIGILSATPAMGILALTYLCMGAMRMAKGQEPFGSEPKFTTKAKPPLPKKDNAKRANV
jgi:hypothetical protein